MGWRELMGLSRCLTGVFDYNVGLIRYTQKLGELHSWYSKTSLPEVLRRVCYSLSVRRTSGYGP